MACLILKGLFMRVRAYRKHKYACNAKSGQRIQYVDTEPRMGIRPATTAEKVDKVNKDKRQT